MPTIFNVSELTDDDLILLNEKYQEKLTRYQLMMNETTERTEKMIHSDPRRTSKAICQ